jgi:hypothetical protein
VEIDNRGQSAVAGRLVCQRLVADGQGEFGEVEQLVDSPNICQTALRSEFS